MHYNRFDIIEAWYLALSECHGGQFSNEYSRLCKLQKRFKPSIIFSKKTLTENGLAIYKQTCKNLLLNRSY